MSRKISEEHRMEYNTQKDRLRISEYGRNVQNMLEYAKTIEDDEKRQKTVDDVVKLMLMMNPQTKNVAEYQEKLWKHVYYIAKYDLEGVVPPTGKVPSPEDDAVRPDALGYPAYKTRYRHYGHNVQILINKALKMEDEEKKEEFTKVIAAYMKLAYKTWNMNANVNDNVIRADLKEISDGQLSLNEDEPINYLANSYVKPKRSMDSRHKGKKGKKSNHHRKRSRKR